jgi:hypothetical protein
MIKEVFKKSQHLGGGRQGAGGRRRITIVLKQDLVLAQYLASSAPLILGK